MPRVFPALLLLLSASATAEIYRWVDPEGRVLFSDRPQPGASTVVPGLQPEGTTKPAVLPTPGLESPPGQAPVTSGAPPTVGPYSSFEIVSPQPNQTLRQAEQRLTISLLLDPPLMAGHQLELLMDGSSLSVAEAIGTQMSLSGIAYGSHLAQAQIRDAQKAVVARTAPVPFHLRKPIPPGVLQ